MISDDQVWLRQPGEPAKAYHAFCHVRDAAPGSSIDAAWRQHETICGQKSAASVSVLRRPTTWSRWSTQWSWIARRDRWLAHLDEEKRRRFLAEQKAAAERHARSVQALISVSLLPARTILARMSTPEFQAALNVLPPGVLLQHAWAASRMVPALVLSERLSLGMSTANIDVDVDAERLQAERNLFADRLVSDPAAVDLALQLLDTITKPQVVDVPASEKAAAPEGGSHSTTLPLDLDDPGDSPV